MALPTTGAITLGMVAAELSISPPLSLGDNRVRALAGKPAGAITLGDLRGKSAYTPPKIISATIAEGYTPASQGSFVDATATLSFRIEGGEAPFDVTWTRLSGSAGISVQGDNPPIFYAYGQAPWTRMATYRATVRDARGAVAESEIISVSLGAGIPL